MTSLKFESGSN